MPIASFFLALCAAVFSATLAAAAPSYRTSGSSLLFMEAVTDGMIADAKAELKEKGANLARMRVTLRNVDDAGFAAFCEAFPETTRLSVHGDLGNLDALRDIAPLAKLVGMTELEIFSTGITDFSPLTPLDKLTLLKIETANARLADLSFLSGMSKLRQVRLNRLGPGDLPLTLHGLQNKPELDSFSCYGMNFALQDAFKPLDGLPALKHVRLTYCTLFDISPLSRLPALSQLDLYGSTGLDLNQLGNCPALQWLDVGMTRVVSSFDALGRLVSLVKLETGNTSLEDISWMRRLVNLQELTMSSEAVQNYAPLGTLKNLVSLEVRDMRAPFGDLGVLSGLHALKKLKLEGDEICGEQALASLTSLEELHLNRMNRGARSAMDLRFLSGLRELKVLSLSDSSVSHSEELAQALKLKRLDIVRTSGIEELEPLRQLADLKRILVSRNAFPLEETSPFGKVLYER